MYRLLIYTVTLLLCGFQAFGQDSTTVDTSAVSNLYNRILSLDEEIRNNPSQQTSNFSPSDSASLPIGIVKEIGNTKYIICIDSAKFTPQGATFSVYMALDFPGADRKIAFAAKNVSFNPKGVIVSNGAKLQLVSKQVVRLGPKTQMVFNDDGKNFIEWDCNGYKQSGLSIDFVFGSDLFINATDESKPVTASMEMVIADLNNISFTLNEIEPFQVKGARDFTFHLQNVVIDRSEFQTPSGVVLPQETLDLYNGDVSSWKGFYAQNATITLPEKLSKHDQPMQVYANDLIIDDAGLTGDFGVNNLFSTTEGEMNDKWGFSIDNLQVGIENNHVTSGVIAGKVIVPPLDDQEFTYSASIAEQDNNPKLKYTFIVSIDSTAVIPLPSFKSELKLLASSELKVESVNDKFIPSATLNGAWTVTADKVKVKGVTFQNVKIGTTSPYITSGTFALAFGSGSGGGNSGNGASGGAAGSNNDDDNECLKFKISLNSAGLTISPQGQLKFSVGLGMNLGSESGTPSFGVSTVVHLVTKIEPDANGRDRIVYDKITLDDIAIDINTSPFKLQGVISIKNDDPIFGDLFYGSIALTLNGILNDPIMVSAGFGRKDGNKYWFTDASVPLSTPTNPGIPIVTGFYLTSLYGGAQSGVASTLSNTELLNRVVGEIVTSGPNVIPFTPDPSQGLTFRAGVGVENQVERVFNGEVMLSVSFNPNGGFASIDLMGQAYMMVARSERTDSNAKKVWGSVYMGYNHNTKTFHSTIDAAIIVPSVLTGNVNVTLHIDPNDWYFWLNRPSNRASLNLINIFYVNTYFMIGTQIDPIPAPPSYVTNLVGGGNLNNTIDLSAVGNGSGFATGLHFGVNFGGEFPKTTKWRGFVDCTVAGGFDMMLFNVENAHCSGSSDPVGVNGYYCIGQVYTYLSGALGVRKYKNGELKKTYNLGSLQLGALLSGKLPKPSFVYGAVGIQANVLGIIDFTFSADVEFGTNCTLVGI